MSDSIKFEEHITPKGDFNAVVISKPNGKSVALREQADGSVVLDVETRTGGVLMALDPADMAALKVFVNSYCLAHYQATGEKTERERPEPPEAA